MTVTTGISPEEKYRLERDACGREFGTELARLTDEQRARFRAEINDVREAWAKGETGIQPGRAYRLAYLGALYRSGPVALRVAEQCTVDATLRFPPFIDTRIV